MLRAALILSLALASKAAAVEFRSYDGHGGPVMGVAVAGDTVLTASFDNSVGLWTGGGAPVWLEGHAAAVNRVAFLPGDRAASGGDDFDVIVWDLATRQALHRLKGHRGKVVALAHDPGGARLASAAWDGSIRLWNLATGAPLATFSDHRGAVTDLRWSGDGARLYSASSDGTVLEWNLAEGAPAQRLAAHGFGVNVLALNEAAGWLAYGAVDGGTRVLALDDGRELADLTADRRPILAMALSPDGSRLAVGDGHGYIMVVDTATWEIARDFRAALNGPIWALAFTADGAGVVAGGIADEAFLWPLDGGDSQPRMAELRRAFHTDPAAVGNGERQFLRKCSICHTLGADGERRAGPPLAGLMGRKAGSVAGYDYSSAVETSGIVWTDHTIDRLFAEGPARYIPGTKMPMQMIASGRDRADLIEFLRRETSATGE